MNTLVKQINRSNRSILLKRCKYINQPIDKTGSRYKHMVRSITARRAFDINPMPSKRAFRGMAGLAVLYPSVVDYIDRMLGTLSASCMGL